MSWSKPTGWSPRRPAAPAECDWEVIESTSTVTQTHRLVRLGRAEVLPADCESRPVGLEELTLAYFRNEATPARTHPPRSAPMTALVSAPALSVRPVAWRRLAWVAWRRYRFTLIGLLVVLGVLGIDLAYSGHQMRIAYDHLMACTPTDSASCRFLDNQFQNKYSQPGLPPPGPAAPTRNPRRLRRCADHCARARVGHVPLCVDSRRRTDALGFRPFDPRRHRRRSCSSGPSGRWSPGTSSL